MLTQYLAVGILTIMLAGFIWHWLVKHLPRWLRALRLRLTPARILQARLLWLAGSNLFGKHAGRYNRELNTIKRELTRRHKLPEWAKLAR